MQVSSTTSQIDPYRYLINEQSVSTTSFTFEKENSYTQEQHASKNTPTDNYIALLASFRSTQSAQYTVSQEQERKDEQTSEVTDIASEQVDEESVKTTKDQEQFDLAMEAYGLHPDNTRDVFMMELIQQGYSENSARERANIYQSAGLLADENGASSITLGDEVFEVYHLSLVTFDPVYKQSLREAYDQMDNEQLKEVHSKVSSQLSLSVDDLKEVMSRDGSKSHEEIREGLKEYWDERYGTPEQVLSIFEKALKSIEIDEKFSKEDLTYIKEGVYLLIEEYKKNLDTSKEPNH